MTLLSLHQNDHYDHHTTKVEFCLFMSGGIIGNGPGGPAGTSGEHIVDMPLEGDTQPKVGHRPNMVQNCVP